MKTVYNTDFIVLNDVVQPLTLRGQRTKLIHLATVARGAKQYVAYASVKKNLVWVEEIHPITNILKKIEDEQEWSDIKDFLYEAQLLEIGSRKPVNISENMAKQLGLSDKPSKREV